MSSVDKVKEFVEYLEKAKIPIGTYNMHAEDSIPVIYKYVSSERVFTCLPDVGDGTLRATQPSALNDPFECAVLKTFVEQSEEEGNVEFSPTLIQPAWSAKWMLLKQGSYMAVCTCGNCCLGSCRSD